MLSWAKNSEDVLLQRAFADVNDGCYIDVGAFLPKADSNTYALYLQGWSGIAVEPLAHLFPEVAQAWANERPRDVLLAVMAAEFDGQRQFWACNARQMSTGSERLLAQWNALGSTIAAPALVPCRRLDSIWPDRAVQLLCIDVENMEGEVLAGLDLEQHRPWLIVLECVRPGTQELVHNEFWDNAPIAHKYYTVHEDGVNRWLLAREHIELATKLRYPPNSFDAWMTARQAELENQLLLRSEETTP